MTTKKKSSEIKLTRFFEAPGRTRVTVTWEPYGAAKPEEIETFVKSRAGMTQGWTGSFEKLENYLGATANRAR